MFDIVKDLLLEFIDLLGWYIPILILFIFLGHIIRSSK